MAEQTQTGQMVIPTVTKEAKAELDKLIPETKEIEQQRMKLTGLERENRKRINALLKQFGLENYKVETKAVLEEYEDGLTAYQAKTVKIKIAKGDAPSETVEDDDSGDE